MGKFAMYEYFIESDKCAASGEYILYRNELFSASDGSLYYKYSPANALDSLEIFVGNTSPVAWGITAFFYCGVGRFPGIYKLLVKGIHFKTVEYFTLYYDIVSKKSFLENDSSPAPKSQIEVNYAFLSQHLVNEINNLQSSEIFYSDPKDKINREIKIKIKEYANAYINWITKKLDDLNKEREAKESLSKRESNHPVSFPHNIAPILASDLHPSEFLTAIEQILSFIYRSFRNQVFPKNHQPNFLPDSLSGKDIGYRYQIHIDPEFLNYSRFMSMVKKLLLEYDIERLKRALRICFEASRSIFELYIKHLDTKEFVAYHTIYFKFESATWQIKYLPSPPRNIHFELYLNHNLGRFAADIYLYLVYEFFSDDEAKVKSLLYQNIKPIDTPLEKEQEFQSPAINNINSSEKLSDMTDLDKYDFFGYIQIIENLLIFIKMKFEFQVVSLNLSNKAVPGSSENKKVEFQYNLEIDPNLINDLYFRKRCKETYVKNIYHPDRLRSIIMSTYYLACHTYSIYADNIKDIKFDEEEVISLRYDQYHGVVTNVLLGSENIFFSNSNFNYFCHNVAAFIQEVFFQNQPVSLAESINKPDINPIQNMSESSPQPVSLINKVSNFSIPKSPPQSETIKEVIKDNLNPPPQAEVPNDPEQTLSDILEPLNNESYIKGKDKKKVICIDTSFKKHLIQCFLAVIDSNEIPRAQNAYTIYSNPPFYDAILLIQHKYNIKTKDIINIIISSRGIEDYGLGSGPAKSIRNELDKAKKRVG